jgi:hypothetical protein
MQSTPMEWVQAPGQWPLYFAECLVMTTATNTRLPKLAGQDQVIIFEGFEDVRLLCFRFPIPFPGSRNGLISMYETEGGHAWKFLDAVQGKTLSAKIVSPTGLERYTLEGVTIHAPEAACNWESQGEGSLLTVLTVNARMYWAGAKRTEPKVLV